MNEMRFQVTPYAPTRILRLRIRTYAYPVTKDTHLRVSWDSASTRIVEPYQLADSYAVLHLLLLYQLAAPYLVLTYGYVCTGGWGDLYHPVLTYGYVCTSATWTSATSRGSTRSSMPCSRPVPLPE